jgi:hypothetical protein
MYNLHCDQSSHGSNTYRTHFVPVNSGELAIHSVSLLEAFDVLDTYPLYGCVGDRTRKRSE